MSSEKFLHEGFPTQSRFLSGNLCLWRLSEVGGICAEAENSERCLSGAIAGMVEWWHPEGGGGGGGEGGDEIANGRNEKDLARCFSFRPFVGIHGQANGR